MKKFIITTDSNADLPKDYVEANNLTIIPQYYAFGDTVYGDELHLTPEEFYQEMAKGAMPTSMANNPQVIREKFEALLGDGYDILHIAFSSELSGSYNNVAVTAQELMEEHPGFVIRVVDSLNVSLGESLLVMEAVEQMEAGKSIDEIVSWLEANKLRVHVEFTVDDLQHLQRGGRISKTTAFLGGMINVKPLLKLSPEGNLVSVGTVRGRKRSLSTLVDNMAAEFASHKFGKRVGIVHAKCLPDAEYMASLIREKHPELEIIINDISPSMGAHAGPGALGLIYLASPRS